MQNDFINNEEEFIRFVNSTFNNDDNNNNLSRNNQSSNRYEQIIENILDKPQNKLRFINIFATYFPNRKIFYDFDYSSTCHICMDISNYCMRICNCEEMKYCIKCFIPYVKTAITSDPAKLNNCINNYQNSNNPLQVNQFIKCSVCHNNPNLIQIENLINNNAGGGNNIFNLAKYLQQIDFFNEVSDENRQWYTLFNADGVIRYNLLYEPNGLEKYKTDLAVLQSGKIWIFEIFRPSADEHSHILQILKSNLQSPNTINRTNEHIKNKLIRFNPNRLILL